MVAPISLGAESAFDLTKAVVHVIRPGELLPAAEKIATSTILQLEEIELSDRHSGMKVTRPIGPPMADQP